MKKSAGLLQYLQSLVTLHIPTEYSCIFNFDINSKLNVFTEFVNIK